MVGQRVVATRVGELARLGILALLGVLVNQFAILPAFAAQPAVFHLSAELSPARSEKVGPKRAGLACLPQGSTRVDDFVSLPDDILLPLRHEFERRGFAVDVADQPAPSLPRLIVRLEKITATLCADSWWGDRSRLKGRATFKFSWRNHASEPALNRTYVVVDSQDYKTKFRLAEFLPLALAQLSTRITPPPG